MSKDSKTITLPERDDMLERLKSVDDDPYTVEKLYPFILKSAGRKLIGAGVVMMLQLAFADYTEGMSGVMLVVVKMNTSDRIDDYITALVDDEKVRSDALEVLNEVREKVSAD